MIILIEVLTDRYWKHTLRKGDIKEIISSGEVYSERKDKWIPYVEVHIELVWGNKTLTLWEGEFKWIKQ